MPPLAGRYRPDRLQDLVQQDMRRPEAVPARTANRLGLTERRQNPSCTAPSWSRGRENYRSVPRQPRLMCWSRCGTRGWDCLQTLLSASSVTLRREQAGRHLTGLSSRDRSLKLSHGRLGASAECAGAIFNSPCPPPQVATWRLEPLETGRRMLAAARGASACHKAHVEMVIGVGIPTCVVPGVAAKILYRAASGTLAMAMTSKPLLRGSLNQSVSA
jgi:hypothetical protein